MIFFTDCDAEKLSASVSLILFSCPKTATRHSTLNSVIHRPGKTVSYKPLKPMNDMAKIRGIRTIAKLNKHFNQQLNYKCTNSFFLLNPYDIRLISLKTTD